jgi:hypothetical protein
VPLCPVPEIVSASDKDLDLSPSEEILNRAVHSQIFIGVADEHRVTANLCHITHGFNDHAEVRIGDVRNNDSGGFVPRVRSKRPNVVENPSPGLFSKFGVEAPAQFCRARPLNDSLGEARARD